LLLTAVTNQRDKNMLVDQFLFEGPPAFLLDGPPAFLQLAALAGVVSAVTYVIISYRKDRPLPRFPIVALDGKSPTESWLFHGNETIKEGLRKVNLCWRSLRGVRGVVFLTALSSQDRSRS
jgi:hypothetical protein